MAAGLDARTRPSLAGPYGASERGIAPETVPKRRSAGKAPALLIVGAASRPPLLVPVDEAELACSEAVETEEPARSG